MANQHQAAVILDPHVLARKIDHPENWKKAQMQQDFVENNRVKHTNGMIALSIACCDDLDTVSRHTIYKAHLLSPDELSKKIQALLDEQSEAHAAIETNLEHVTRLMANGTLAGVSPKHGG